MRHEILLWMWCCHRAHVVIVEFVKRPFGHTASCGRQCQARQCQRVPTMLCIGRSANIGGQPLPVAAGHMRHSYTRSQRTQRVAQRPADGASCAVRRSRWTTSSIAITGHAIWCKAVSQVLLPSAAGNALCAVQIVHMPTAVHAVQHAGTNDGAGNAGSDGHSPDMAQPGDNSGCTAAHAWLTTANSVNLFHVRLLADVQLSLHPRRWTSSKACQSLTACWLCGSFWPWSLVCSSVRCLSGWAQAGLWCCIW